MRSVSIVWVGCFLIALAGCTPSVTDKLVGTWKAEKANGKPIPQGQGTTLHFGKDGKCTLTIDKVDKQYKSEWTYTVNEMRIKMTCPSEVPGKTTLVQYTIQSITDNHLRLEGPQNLELKRKE
jgi:uncharacterized protein (TIGR03066 family)